MKCTTGNLKTRIPPTASTCLWEKTYAGHFFFFKHCFFSCQHQCQLPFQNTSQTWPWVCTLRPCIVLLVCHSCEVSSRGKAPLSIQVRTLVVLTHGRIHDQRQCTFVMSQDVRLAAWDWWVGTWHTSLKWQLTQITQSFRLAVERHSDFLTLIQTHLLYCHRMPSHMTGKMAILND